MWKHKAGPPALTSLSWFGPLLRLRLLVADGDGDRMLKDCGAMLGTVARYQAPSSYSKSKPSGCETTRPTEGSGKWAVSTKVSVSQ